MGCCFLVLNSYVMKFLYASLTALNMSSLVRICVVGSFLPMMDASVCRAFLATVIASLDISALSAELRYSSCSLVSPSMPSLISVVRVRETLTWSITVFGSSAYTPLPGGSLSAKEYTRSSVNWSDGDRDVGSSLIAESAAERVSVKLILGAARTTSPSGANTSETLMIASTMLFTGSSELIMSGMRTALLSAAIALAVALFMTSRFRAP